MTGRVAIVEDESNQREAVQFALRREGYAVESYADGLEAWNAFSRRLPDVVVLDVTLPRMDGYDLCRRLRTVSERVPIIFVSGRDEEIDKVLGLELGADDYLSKPFSLRELVARIRVLFRRAALSSLAETASDRLPIRIGRLELDPDRYRAAWDGAKVDLTATEFLMLCALAKRPDRVRTRDDLIREAYRYDNHVSDRTIDSHIKRLRRKLEHADPTFDRIEAVYGVGYRYRGEGD